MNVTGILMAGGKSSRMGTDKSLLTLGGKNLFRWNEEKLEKVCTKVIISSNKYYHTKHFILKDDIADIGPIGGIYTSLKYTETELNLVLSVDMPFIQIPTLLQLLDYAEGSLVVVPGIEGKTLEPLCAVYHKNCLPYIESEIKKGNYKMHEIIGGIPSKIINLSSIRDQFLNINNPNDFQKASQKFQSLSS